MLQKENLPVGIVGAGTMGSAIAQKFAQQEFNVILIDIKKELLERAQHAIKKTLNEGTKRKLFTPEQVEKILARIDFTTDYSRLSTCQLVIEAVFEDFEIKKSVFKQISEIVPETCIIATNTSSFSVTDLSKSVMRPERFIGMHFFYHAAKNRLVEIIPGTDTSQHTLHTSLKIMRRLDKDPIVCKDVNGFVVNRFFVPWLNEAVRMYENGLSSMEAIDSVFCEIFGIGMGPFALMNATGVPIAYHAQDTLYQAFGGLYKPSELLKKQADTVLAWDLKKTTTDQLQITPTMKQQIRQHILGLLFIIWGQLLDEQVCTFDDIQKGAKIGLRWRISPHDLIRTTGKQKVVELATTVARQWNLQLPHSLTSDHWERLWKPEFIVSKKKGTLAIITLNRPEDLNALNPLVVDELDHAFTTIEQDPAIKTVIITGSGKAFMAGADIKFFIESIKSNNFSAIYEFTKKGHDLLSRIDNSSKQIIMLINGLALGGGLELALCGDYVLAGPRASMAFPETGIGIYPGLGGTQRTPKRIGKELSKYLIYTGNTVNGQQALEIGLVDHVVSWDDVDGLLEGNSEVLQKTLKKAMAKKQKGSSPSQYWTQIVHFFKEYTLADILAMAENKNQLNGLGTVEQDIVKKIAKKSPLALNTSEKLIDEAKGLQAELEHLKSIFSTEDALIGLESVVSGTPPRFKGK